MRERERQRETETEHVFVSAWSSLDQVKSRSSQKVFQESNKETTYSIKFGCFHFFSWEPTKFLVCIFPNFCVHFRWLNYVTWNVTDIIMYVSTIGINSCK